MADNQLDIRLYALGAERHEQSQAFDWHSDSDAEPMDAGLPSERESDSAERRSGLPVQRTDEQRSVGGGRPDSPELYRDAQKFPARPQVERLEHRSCLRRLHHAARHN